MATTLVKCLGDTPWSLGYLGSRVSYQDLWPVPAQFEKGEVPRGKLDDKPLT